MMLHQIFLIKLWKNVPKSDIMPITQIGAEEVCMSKNIKILLMEVVLLAVAIFSQLTVEGQTNIGINLVYLVIGFALLIKGADWFVDGASKIADKLGIPKLVVALTIVAFGTSAPEAAVSISAAMHGDSSIDIAIGNVLGSNIMNVLVILGIACIICPLAVQKSTKRYEIPFVIFISVLLSGLGMFDGSIGKIDGFIFVALLIMFVIYLLIMAKKGQGSTEEVEGASADDKIWQMIVSIIIGGTCIVIGSNVTVSSASVVAAYCGMSSKLIGLTVVALGTSLPELITSSMAAARKQADIAIGNIVGSNIFNVLFVLGMAAVVSPKALPFKVGATDFFIDSIVAIAAVVLLLIGVLNKKSKLNRWCGVLMLASYAGYFVFLLISNGIIKM